MDEELDAGIAVKIMGWKPHKYGKYTTFWRDAEGNNTHYTALNFTPSSSLDHCAMAEVKMGKLGKEKNYIKELCALLKVWRQKFTNPGLVGVYKIATAPADVRCRAMLEAVKASDD